jgi:hypothetical protein
MRISLLVTLATLVVARDSANSQAFDVSAQVIPLITSATHTATRGTVTEGYLTQPVVMAHVTWGAVRGISTLNFEGLTLDRGELSTGGYGEGYVDRRHPHAYIHELLVGAEKDGPISFSLFAGRGFAPFGSDDPMVRPFVKYPVNHHLAQVLERVIAVGAAQYGPAILEVGAFNGDEPLSPSSAPRYSRFGDSWSSRLTLLPASRLEVSGSYASVRSPELAGGQGLDQSKMSLVGRVESVSPNSSHYALIEWARTRDLDHGRTTTTLLSRLAESAYCRSNVTVGLRAEMTDRPEEEPLANPFRVGRPSTDLSNLGVSRWSTVTGSIATPVIRRGQFSGRPFAEIAWVSAEPGTPPGVFNAQLRYGASQMWMFSGGIRLAFGMTHGRMGRYGAAMPAMQMDESETTMHMSHNMPMPQCGS